MTTLAPRLAAGPGPRSAPTGRSLAYRARCEYYSYDVLGNKQEITKVWHPGWDQQSSPPVPAVKTHYYNYAGSELDSVNDSSGPVMYYDWDDMGRLEQWTSYDESPTATRSFTYEASGRLAEVYQPGQGNFEYWYDADDQLVLETLNGYSLAGRFNGATLFMGPSCGSQGCFTENYLPMVGARNGYLMLLLNEPGGNTAWMLDQAGQLVDQEVQGVYASAFAGEEQRTDFGWPEGGLHGSDVNWYLPITHMGARHMLSADGTWLQPEPLLYLGPTNGDLREPLLYGPLYANGNTLSLKDDEGFWADALLET